MKFNEDRRLNINYNRLLAKHDIGKELRYTGLREKLSDNNMDNRKKNVAENVSKYSQIKGIGSNNIDAYMKDYKRRYGEKKGLYKLDCYCEKKLFSKIHHIDEIKHRFKNDNKRFKKLFIRKYGIGPIFFALIPALGFIFPMLFCIGDGKHGIIEQCPKEHFDDQNKHKTTAPLNACTTKWLLQHNKTINICEYVSYIYMITMCIVVFLFVSFIFIKFIKYKRLKAGKMKMSIKVY